MTDIGEEPIAQPVRADGDPQTPGPSARSVTRAVPPKCPTRTRLYRAGRVLDEGFPAEEISERLARDPRSVAWLDLYDPTRIADTQLNEQSAELNEITKRLAAWAAIIAVPTAVTGFYGQNVPYPGFGHHDGFLVSCVVMVVLAGSLFLYLRKRNWL